MVDRHRRDTRSGRSSRISAGGFAVNALLLAALGFWSPLGDARAVIIETGDGTGNVTAPPDDPGWSNLGTRGGTTVVYLGRRWVLTANHVGVGDVIFDGQTYSPVPGSKVRFENPDSSLADLMVFKIFDNPGLRRLDIPDFPPAVGNPVTTIGYGLNRGAPTTFMGLGGYEWGVGRSMRWGTNIVSATDLLVTDTYSFATTFTDPLDPSATADESAGANGDSGGAAFTKIGDDWYLVGTLFAISQYTDQPANTSIYDNKLYAADLSHYRADILAVIEQKSCSDGLDDDGDGFTDYPADPECASAGDDSESIPGVPALGFPGMILLVGAILLVFAGRSRLRAKAI
ncbi:MAG: trypsin-like serine protease [Deltaproteobacteria bacterium]|nr:trypsin-like serine protease [Deltaproteobacteria bacterium]